MEESLLIPSQRPPWLFKEEVVWAYNLIVWVWFDIPSTLFFAGSSPCQWTCGFLESWTFFWVSLWLWARTLGTPCWSQLINKFWRRKKRKLLDFWERGATGAGLVRVDGPIIGFKRSSTWSVNSSKASVTVALRVFSVLQIMSWTLTWSSSATDTLLR